MGWAATMKTGPNDASGVVWALGELFFFFFVFFNTNYCFLDSNVKIQYRVSSYNENGPRQCQTRHLGPR
jgi:hypothetical protein